HRAQVQHVAGVGTGKTEPAGRGAGGEQELVIGHRLGARGTGRGHGGGGAGDGGDGDAWAQVHAVLGVPVGGVDVDRVSFVAAEQVSLGQRRALVRAFR